MKTEDFIKYLEQLRTTTKSKQDAAASILFMLSQDEAETNSQYAAAYSAVKELLGNNIPAVFEDYFKEIMQDENNHCLKFQALAAQCFGVKIGNLGG